jgi:CAAX prenyl protease-like protein
VALEQVAGGFLAAAIDPRWLTVARGGIVALVLALAWPHYSELRPAPAADATPGRGARDMALAVASGVVVFLLWIALDRGWAVVHRPGPGFIPLDAQGRLDWPLCVLRLAGFALVVPLAEELFWRSFLLRWIDRRRFLELDPRRASLKAFAICSVLFALEHSQWLAGLVAGMIYTGVYTRTGNLRVPIVAHAITNATLGIWIVLTQSWSLW